jgi:hypothetical protein
MKTVLKYKTSLINVSYLLPKSLSSSGLTLESGSLYENSDTGTFNTQLQNIN